MIKESNEDNRLFRVTDIKKVIKYQRCNLLFIINYLQSFLQFSQSIRRILFFNIIIA